MISCRGRRDAHLEPNTGLLLQRVDSAEKICRSGIAARSEHAHQTFRRGSRSLRQGRKSDGRIDVGAKRGLGRIRVAGEKPVDGFVEQRRPEGGIAGRARPYCFC